MSKCHVGEREGERWTRGRHLSGIELRMNEQFRPSIALLVMRERGGWGRERERTRGGGVRDTERKNGTGRVRKRGKVRMNAVTLDPLMTRC